MEQQPCLPTKEKLALENSMVGLLSFWYGCLFIAAIKRKEMLQLVYSSHIRDSGLAFFS